MSRKPNQGQERHRADERRAGADRGDVGLSRQRQDQDPVGHDLSQRYQDLRRDECRLGRLGLAGQHACARDCGGELAHPDYTVEIVMSRRADARPASKDGRSRPTRHLEAGRDRPIRYPNWTEHAQTGSSTRRVRLHHRRRGLGRLRARQPAFGRSGQPGPAARGGRQGQLDLVPHPGRLPLRHRQSARRLDVQDRAGSRASAGAPSPIRAAR